jgi:hypothetical protein
VTGDVAGVGSDMGCPRVGLPDVELIAARSLALDVSL